MDFKKFVVSGTIIVAAAAMGWAVKYQTPEVTRRADWSGMPLQKGDWNGAEDIVAQGVVDLLMPDAIFQANYTGPEGVPVNLFLGSWSDPRGGPHSPLNCLPASGWIVLSTEPHPVEYEGRTIPAQRLRLSYHRTEHLMDFWYITPYGETSNDYRLKLYEMLTSLTFQPRHLTFVRFVARNSESGRRAMDRCEKDFLQEIYGRLPQSAN